MKFSYWNRCRYFVGAILIGALLSASPGRAATPLLPDGNVQAVGILASSDPAFSRVILASGERQQVFAIGEQVTRSLVVQSIAADHVVLTRGGKTVILLLGPTRNADALAVAQHRTTADGASEAADPDTRQAALTGTDPVLARMAQMRAQVSANPPPPPPPSATVLNLQRNREGPKFRQTLEQAKKR